MKKGILAGLALALSLSAKAQNITDQAVLQAGAEADVMVYDDNDDNRMPQDAMLHPDRISIDNRCVQIEGKDVFLLGGTMHYFRVAEPLWRDRLVKMKQMGCNMVETYVPWNWHERQMPASPDDFSKVDLGPLERFLTLAEQVGLYVMVRPGPYICAEWKGGGFPLWLMQKRPADTRHEVWLQSDDPVFVGWSKHWYEAVARVVAPHQIFNRQPGTGGVILWQLENEYNRVKWVPSSGKRAYLEELARASRSYGIEVPFITCWTSEARSVGDGPLRGCVDMVNSYPRWNIEKGFGRLINQQQKSMPGKPLISGELQGGWYSAIGGKESWQQDGVAPVQTQNITLYALQRGFCALNFYMLVGGTNFDDWASREATCTYDFAAAIGEDGTTNGRYDRLRLLSIFLMEHGPRIARARLMKADVQTADSLVSAALRRTARGDRYVFIRTEDHTLPHKGSLTIDGLAIDFDLEPFGSMVYYVPAGQTTGTWLTTAASTPMSYAPDRKAVSLTVIDRRQDDLPTSWQKLPAGLTVDRQGLYGYHPIYYKTEAKAGSLLTIGRTGEKAVNGTIGDEVAVWCDNRQLTPTESNDREVAFQLPQKGDAPLTCIILYMSPGLHHHTNKAVETYWHTGPQWVRADGQDLQLSYAYTEAGRGRQLSDGGKVRKPRALSTPLLTWTRYTFTTPPDGQPCYIQLEPQGNGFVYVNGRCLGRVWQQGPQRCFYVPECWLNSNGVNHVAVSSVNNGS